MNDTLLANLFLFLITASLYINYNNYKEIEKLKKEKEMGK